MTQFVHGNDISAWQGETDFEVMKAAGSEFVYLRKSIGYYKDLRFWDYFDGVKQAELPMGVYHYFYAGYSVERQFQKFIEGIQPSDLAFPPILDVEHRHSVSKSRAVTDVLKMLYLLDNWWTGERMPAIYTAKFVWEDYYSRKPGWIHDWDLFVANYTDAEWPKYVPTGWTHTAAGISIDIKDQFETWQWEADGNNKGSIFGVSSHDIDMDKMHRWYFETFNVPNPPDDPSEPIQLELIVPTNEYEVTTTVREN